MKKYLMRAGMSPLKYYPAAEVISSNLIGSNIGNMLFPYSISRALMQEGDTIRTMSRFKNVPKSRIDYINSHYDYFILPFANAFRISFAKDLKAITKFVKQLTIPCIVVGVGAQAPMGKEPANPALDAAVTDFMKAVLEKSSIVGLRGEFTADYLKRLGFTPEKDFTVIGCPSMYLYGGVLPEMEVKELTPESNVSTNSKIQLGQPFHNFMARSRKAIPNYHYVMQVIQEINLMYYGIDIPDGFAKTIPEHFPVSYDDPMYQSGKGISFVNVPTWLEYLRNKDFSYGSRIHGNIASILAGTPCFIMVSDERIRELVDYHQIPHMFNRDLTDDVNIFDLHEHADFSGIHKGHDKRFAHYLDFLHENGLETIYDNNISVENAPFDQKVAELKIEAPLQARATLTEAQWKKRQKEMSDLRVKYYKTKRRINRKLNRQE